jgi:glutamine cyclotransferase
LNKTVFIFLLITARAACSDSSGSSDNTHTARTAEAIPVINYGVQKYFAHDTTSYTEGLLFHNGMLFESTGSPDQMPDTRSLVGPVDLTNGKINKKIEINHALFGEGIVFLNNKLYQLTYKAKKGYVYDAATFKLLDSFPFANEEGWGLTTDGTSIIMSDGTCNISYITPANYKVTKTLRVTDNNGPVMQLNELEYVNGYLYANIYTTNTIVKIDTRTGRVVGTIDCTSLAQEARARYSGSMEMNGIAYDSTTSNFYVTGKMWPNIYAISFPH